MLAFDDLTKLYGEHYALNHLSFEVPPGVVFGFLGPNGAGKTTAMRSIFNLVKLDSGTVTFQGAPITKRLSKRFGYMPEERGLYSKMTVIDHLIYLARLHGVSSSEARRRAGSLIEELEIKGGGGVKVESLSLGNQQRAQIAATLISEPELIVMDEPFSGLDPLSVEIVRRLLEDRAKKGNYVLFSSHQLEVVEDMCERVAIIDNGSLIVSDDTEALLSTRDQYIIQLLPGHGDLSNLVIEIDLIDLEGERLLFQANSIEEANKVASRFMDLGVVESFHPYRLRLSDVFRKKIEEMRNGI
ncbi:MAG: ATP-binding cassette domain-containing protein [Actinomycetota bacterium]|nr:ATP-binding cassette domain-containing protein [Actinomycetota bacterium]